MPVPRTLHEDQTEFQRLRTGSIAAGAGKPTAAFPAVVELLWKSARQQDTSALLAESLPAIVSAIGADFAALVRSRDARWSIEAETGARRPLPQDLLAEVLDREAAAGDGQWMAAPLTPRDAASGVLVAHVAKPA